jgi:hypothetical protein
MAQLVEVDNRKRISLGSAVRAVGTQYMVEVDPDGVITLTPALVLSEVEARLLHRPDILAAVDKAITDDVWVSRPARRK